MVLVSLPPGIVVNLKKAHTKMFVQWVQKDTFNLPAVIGGFFFSLFLVFSYMLFFHIIMIPSSKIPS